MHQKLAITTLTVSALAWAAGEAAAAEVTLRMKGGGFQLSGELKAYDNTKFVIDNKTLGTMTLDATKFDCIGAGCPRAQPTAVAPAGVGAPARPAPTGRANVIGIHGSNVVGTGLMPVLIQGYAGSIRAGVT